MKPLSEIPMTRRQMVASSASLLAAAALAGCSSSGSSNSSSSSADTDDVTQRTATPGKLTVATGDPAFEPWVMNDDPASGQGFEAALTYKLAEKMGFSDDDVVWVRTTFDESYAPGDHDWDINVQQVSINDDRKKAVDFSPAYFRPTQSVVAVKGSTYASATTVDALKDATFAVMVGSTAYDYVKEIFKDGGDDGVDVFNDNSNAAAAVSAGQADVLVTDTPQCVYMVQSGQVADGVVVGQIPGTEDQYGFGMTLAKDSPLTSYVTDAMNDLLDDGTVEELQNTWLAEYTTDVPELEA